ncbi:phosphopantetheine-binding protein [Paracoccus mangrovi]|jgi:bifunctional isochorismate lyase/aryl carrier protein|uniref:Phosphopantetheine-binding protein n=1 Tax=Paracoccus mangrovi TaxID=1715645 RepID=A0ABV7R3T7_9RHOB
MTMDIAQKARIDRDWLTARAQQLIEDDCDIDPAENLVLYGLDSIAVMTFSAELKQMGVEASFEELAREPSLENWWALISSRL